MKYRRWVLIGLLLVLMVAGTACDEIMGPDCSLRFAGTLVEARSDPRAGGPYYSMPIQGGDVILQLGAYVPTLEDVEAEALILGGGEIPPEVWEMLAAAYSDSAQPLSQLKVRIYDREDPTRVLYSFEGSWQDFAMQPNAEAKFSGSRGIVISLPLSVPPGTTWWMGKIEAYSTAMHGHADKYLIQGGLDAWIQQHGGKW